MRKTWKLGLAAVTTSILVSSAAFAATQNFSAEVAFATPLTLTKVSDMDFGVVKASTAAIYTLSTAGVVTANATGEVIGGTPNAGELDIAGSISQQIDITTDGLIADNGVTPTLPQCSYDGGAESACDALSAQAAPGLGKPLLVGVTITADGTQADGTTASPTFNVNVVYN